MPLIPDNANKINGCDGNDCNQYVAHHEGEPDFASAFVSASVVAFDFDDEFDNWSNHLSAVG